MALESLEEGYRLQATVSNQLLALGLESGTPPSDLLWVHAMLKAGTLEQRAELMKFLKPNDD